MARGRSRAGRRADRGDPSTAGDRSRGILHSRERTSGGPSTASGRSRWAFPGQGEVPGEPARPGADPEGASTARRRSRGGLKAGDRPRGSLHGRDIGQAWPGVEGRAAPGQAPSSRPPQESQGPRGSSPERSPCPAPEVPPGTHGALRRRCCRAAPPGRCCRFRFRCQGRPRAPRRAGEGAACRPVGPRTQMRHPPCTGIQDTGTPCTGTGTNTHTTPCTGSGHATPQCTETLQVQKSLFFLYPKCCHLHTEMLPTGERNSQT